jgi:putative transposase
MKRRFTEEQIIGLLREQEGGSSVKEVTRRHGISEQSFYRWKAKYGGMGISDARRPEGARGGERKAGEASGRGAPGQRGFEGRAQPKVVRPAGTCAVVAHLVQAHGLSLRRACWLAELTLSTWQYAPRRQACAGLRERLKELAAARRRFGYRRLHALLRREGWRVNRKAVHRIYVEEGLQVRKRKRKRVARAERRPLLVPQARNQRWSMDSGTISWPPARDSAPSTSSTT